MTREQAAKTRFVVCIRNDGYVASLEKRRVYRVLPDAEAKRLGMYRIIDESGEDYLYPTKLFAGVSLHLKAKQALLKAV